MMHPDHDPNRDELDEAQGRQDVSSKHAEDVTAESERLRKVLAQQTSDRVVERKRKVDDASEAKKSEDARRAADDGRREADDVRRAADDDRRSADDDRRVNEQPPV